MKTEDKLIDIVMEFAEENRLLKQEIRMLKQILMFEEENRII